MRRHRAPRACSSSRQTGFVRTGDDAAGSKHRSCAQVVSRAINLTLSAVCNAPTATLGVPKYGRADGLHASLDLGYMVASFIVQIEVQAAIDRSILDGRFHPMAPNVNCRLEEYYGVDRRLRPGDLTSAMRRIEGCFQTRTLAASSRVKADVGEMIDHRHRVTPRPILSTGNAPSPKLSSRTSPALGGRGGCSSGWPCRPLRPC